MAWRRWMKMEDGDVEDGYLSMRQLLSDMADDSKEEKLGTELTEVAERKVHGRESRCRRQRKRSY